MQTLSERDFLGKECRIHAHFVIFGGTGDLAHRKLLPALYHLFLESLLPRAFAIISYASTG